MSRARLKLMLLPLLAASAFKVEAAVDEGFVSGAVDVKAAANFRLVGNELGSTFFPGHKITIVLDRSKPIDINAVNRWEETCFIWCSRREWIDHYWHTPDKWPTIFRLVDEAGTPASGVGEVWTVDGRAEISIPYEAPGFNQRFRLEAKVAQGQPPIDPNRSQGQFQIRISVDTAQRAVNLASFLANPGAPAVARDLRKAWVNDPFFLEQNRSFIAKTLVWHAQKSFPVANNPANAREHNELLEYAAEIDPVSSDASFARAELFLAQGKGTNAEEVLINEIRKLQALPRAQSDRGVQTNLARAFNRLGQAMEERGYLESGDIADIVAQYTKAIDLATSLRIPEILVEARTGRGFTNRKRNTSSGFETATEDFKAARALSPTILRGLPVSIAPNDQHLLAVDTNIRTAMIIGPVSGSPLTSRMVEVPGQSIRPVAIAEGGRLLAQSGSGLGWMDFSKPNPTFRMQMPLSGQVTYGDTNGKISVIAVADKGQVGAMLITESLIQKQITIDGKQPALFEIAGEASRYAVSSVPGVGAGAFAKIELRNVGIATDDPVVGVSTPPNVVPRVLRVSPDGRKFGIVTQEGYGPDAKHSVVIWTEGGAPTTVASYAQILDNKLNPATWVSFSFSPDSERLVAVLADGSIWSFPLSAGAQGELYASAGTITFLGAGVYARAITLRWPNMKTLVIDTGLNDRVWLLDWSTKIVSNIQTSLQVASEPVWWMNSQGEFQFASTRAMPVSLYSIATDSAQVSLRGVVDRTSVPNFSLLSGGRYVCIADEPSRSLSLKDLQSGEERLVAKIRNTATGAPLTPVCRPNKIEHQWTLVWVTEKGAVESIEGYRAFDKEAQPLPLTIAPPDVLTVAEEAKRQYPPPPGLDILPPAFIQVGTADMPGRSQKPFILMSIPTATGKARPAGAPVKWFSLPYVSLDDRPFVIRRLRLPVEAIVLDVWEEPEGRVVYLDAGKVYLKDLNSDTQGTLLFAVPTPPPPVVTQRLASNRSRLLFGEALFTGPNVANISIRPFAIDGAGAARPLPCTQCQASAVSLEALNPPGMAPASFLQWGVFQSDVTLRQVARYTASGLDVIDVETDRAVATLPAKQLVWLGTARAFYLNDSNQFSFVRY